MSMRYSRRNGNRIRNKNLQEGINIAPLVDLKERENSDELYKKLKISNA